MHTYESGGDSYVSRVCKLLQLYWQISHLKLKGIKKKVSRYVLLTHTHTLYFQTSQKKTFARYKAFYFILLKSWVYPMCTKTFQVLLKQSHWFIESWGSHWVGLLLVEQPSPPSCSCIPPHLITNETNIFLTFFLS